MKHLQILPVYSQLAIGTVVGSTTLYRHQADTLATLQDPNSEVVFNLAMTADGKSLAGFLSALQNTQHVLAMYPTNELILDQLQALPRYEERLQLRFPRYGSMYGEQISALMRVNGEVERLEEIRKRIRHHPLLLTNPDMVHLIMSLQYSWGHKRKELPFEVEMQYDQLNFDEFHVFEVPQVIAVANMLGYFATLYQHKPDERKKFLFLSATPGNLLHDMLARGNTNTRTIHGSYHSTPYEGFRCILRPCSLELHEVGPDCSIEQWVASHLETIRDFFLTNDATKGAILVNSVAAAKRLVVLLKKQLEQACGISVGENTGLTSRQERTASREKRLLVGTSTVDVGIDFRINLLIFEAYSSGTFIQRFGRLGRHEGFSSYHAYALVPRFVLERFELKLEQQEEVERETFNSLVYDIFPLEAEFRRYRQRWGVLQAAQILAELQQQSDENTSFRESLTLRYEQFYGNGDSACPVMHKALKRYWAIKHRAPEIVAELSSFRGQSPLSCAVWDTTDDHFQVYDLFFLLANTEFSILERTAFLQEVQRRQLDPRTFDQQLLYFKVCSYVAERQSLVLYVNEALSQSSQSLHVAHVRSGIAVLAPQHDWLVQVNTALKKVRLVCTVSDIPIHDLRRQLHLGPLFQLQQLEDMLGSRYSIAFGQDALLLDTELYVRKTRTDPPMML